MTRLLPGERVLWEGRPEWRALARDVLHTGWLAGYIAVLLICGAVFNRLDGLGPIETLRGGVPLFGAGLLVLAACTAFAWACARTTTYTITTERCILRYGLALTATVSVPLRVVARVSVAAGADGVGHIPLTLKPGSRVGFLRLWPHVRPWRYRRAEPALRGVPHALSVAALLGEAALAVAPGRLHAIPSAPDRHVTGVALGAASGD